MYTVGSLSFTRKEDVSDHARQIKDSAPIGGHLRGDDLEFMFGLLRWHPFAAEKIGVGIDAIIVRLNPSYNQREFYLLRSDGTGTDFSYRQCLNPSTPVANFRTACRRAIAPQMIAFRDHVFGERVVLYCELTGERLTRASAHVDHVPPNTFQSLLKQFVDLEAFNGIPSVTGRNLDNSFTVRLADAALEQRWQNFHAAHARLRLISEDANLRIVGHEWDVILDYLRQTDHADALVEWKRKQYFYTHLPEVDRGILVSPERAPANVPVFDGTLAILEIQP